MRSQTHAGTRTATPVHLLIALALLCSAALVAVQTAPAEAAAAQKCIGFDFHYVDGHTDGGQLCTTGSVGSIINVTSANHPGLHVTSLHVSCSDTFDVPVHDGSGTLIGYASNGHSDLAGHLVAPHPDTPGVPWFSITKSWADDCTSAPVATYGLSVLKEISVDAGTTWADADDPGSTDTPAVDEGDTVRYRITVTNTGTGDLTDVVVDDNRFADCDTTIASLPVADPVWTCEFDATAGSSDLENTATASVAARSLSDSDDANYTVDPPDPVYGLDVVKHVSTDGTTWYSGEAADDDGATATTGIPAVDEGDTVHFRITVTSTGDPLSLVSLADSLYDLGALDLDAVTTDDCSESDTVTDGDLTVGALDSTWTCRFSVVAGAAVATNTATASSLEEQTPAASDTAAYTVDPAIPPGDDAPSLQVVKTPSTTGADVGDTVTYTYVVTNTGDVTLTDVTAVDDLLGAVTLTTTTLAPGASTSGTLTHTVVDADLPGPIVNVVVATGTPPVGDNVTDRDEASVSLSSDPGISLTKVADTQLARPGQTITYTYVVTNTGDVTLTGVTLVDDPLGAVSLLTTTLAPGASTTATATHVVDAADLAAGVVVNTAVATGTAPDGTEVDDDADESVVVEGVQDVVIERPDPPRAPEPAPDPRPAPDPDPVSPTSLPRTGTDGRVALLALGMLALGALLVHGTPGRRRPGGQPA